ncbi:MAG: ribosomal RNA small subunit methyltransferase A [Proteobacteria bacterium]|nr:ribosomal RNA small subunit methyltransferase A [Pseudomonadota bacterium]
MALMRAKKRFGQHFLTDKNLLKKIVRTASVEEGDVVLEIGPGRGALTAELLNAGATVVAVEVDRNLSELLRKKFSRQEGFSLVEGDIVKMPFSEITGMEIPTGADAKKKKSVSNLPYNITGPMLFRFLEERDRFDIIVLLLQKEVAERLAAVPSTKGYNALSVLMQVWFDISREFEVKRTLFVPPPKVDSTVVSLVPRAAPRVATGDPVLFKRVVKAAFSLRRKMLSNSLKTLGVAPELIGAALSGAQIDPKRRAETLTLEEFSSLVLSFARTGAEGLREIETEAHE